MAIIGHSMKPPAAHRWTSAADGRSLTWEDDESQPREPSFPTGNEDEQGRWIMVWEPWLTELIEATEEMLHSSVVLPMQEERLQKAVQQMKGAG